MEIREFISETLSEIVAGIKDAKPKVQEAGGAVNPKGCEYLNLEKFTIQHKATSRVGDNVEFEIAITAAKEEDSGGKIGASIKVLEASIGGGSKAESGSISRVKFKVPVIFPKSVYSE